MLQIQCFCILEVMTIVYLQPEILQALDIITEVTPFQHLLVSIL